MYAFLIAITVRRCGSEYKINLHVKKQWAPRSQLTNKVVGEARTRAELNDRKHAAQYENTINQSFSDEGFVV